MSVARVVVDIASRSLSEPFDYEVPQHLQATARVGCPVAVDFGNRTAVGYIADVADTSQVEHLKPLRDVMGEPLFDCVSASIADWIAREYVCPLSEALRLFLPPGGTPRVLRDDDGTWRLKPPRVGHIERRWVSLVPDSGYRPPANAHLQRLLLTALAEGPVAVSELAAEFGAVSSAIKRLVQVGAVIVESRCARRAPDAYVRSAPRPAHLTRGQQEALDAIVASDPGHAVVLDGVTGSGKTEVYLQAIERTLDEGRQAIVLVPEISLTPQTVGRFRARFGDDIAVLHSRLGAGERFDEWERIRRGEGRVVVGARSALFAPVRNVGLIVIDEEHEGSYKQGSAPRYHARDVAARLASERRAVLVLGSATPSMESLQRCEAGEWRRLVLPDRATGAPLPDVHVVDMAAEFQAGHRSMFSRPLAQALAECAAARDKAVLLLNRRGYASFVLCRECGHVPTCDSCSTSLTYHDTTKSLVCHHCGSSRLMPGTCPVCESPFLRVFGAGTQRVESELRSLLPEVPVVRMDADTTTGKGGHERQLAAFEAAPYGILIGTQMVAKGLDYPEVTLVGVLNADTTLHMPDFRAGERTYQLLAQVAGRAGRGTRVGRVIVQTYWPAHSAIVAASTHDPSPLVAEERQTRAELEYPPFGRLANVLVTSPDDRAARQHAEALAAAIVSRLPEGWSLLGPSRAPLARIKRAYRWHVLLKAPAGAPISRVVSDAIAESGRAEGVTVAPDVDPVDLL